MSALDELRDNLRVAAEREIAARRVRRRRQRRATGLLIGALFGVAAAAGAADLITVGEPATDLRLGMADDYRPPPGTLRPRIAVRADSGGLELPYAVGYYDTARGKRCLLAGSLLSYTLGVIDGNEFKPFKRDRTGVCAKPVQPNSATLPDHGRLLVFGRATAEKPNVAVIIDGKTIIPRLGEDRIFLVVYRGDFPRARVAVKITR